MTESDGLDNDEVLERLLAGDLDPADAAAQRLLETDTEARERFAELQRLAGRLGRLGQDEREVLSEAAADGGTDVDVLEGARAALRERYGSAEPVPAPSQAPVPGSPWVALVGIFGSLAAALLVWFVVRGAGIDPFEARREPRGDAVAAGDLPPAEVLLLGSKADLLRPSGEVDDFSIFEWELELPPGGWYELVIEAGGQVSTWDELTQASFTVPAGWLDAAAEIEWRVFAYDALGGVSGSAEASAQRR